jgi:NADH dehydrogenase FAD-containing subunit
VLASSAVGTVEYRSMTEATRAANPMIEQYIEGKAIDVDVERRVLKVQVQDLMQDTRGPVGGGTNSSNGGDDSSSNVDSSLVEISYDKLVVAVGCKVLDTIVPGADRYTYKLKTCDDARLLRTAVGECLEYACRPHVAPISNLDETQAHRRRALRRKRLTWVIVGGGPTGVELAGELSDFVADITKPRVGSYHKLHGEVQIVLVQGAPFLVPQFEEPLRHHALATLSRQGVDVRLDTLVQEVGDGWIKLQRKDDGSGIGEVETLDFGLCVWAAGIAPVPFVDTLLSKLPEQAKGPNGRVNVDKWLRCPTETSASFGSILVMGDAAAFIESSSSSQNATGTVFLPQTAQVAAQMGAYVARMLDRGYNLSQTPPVLVYHDETENDDDFALAWLKIRGLQEAPGFQFLNLGMLAYLGQGNALSQFQLGDVPIFSYVGSVAFMLWRSVYLVKQVATRNRILVLFDWAKCKIFGRDITRL